MIATLHGELRARGSDWVLIEVGGIGFRVRVPAALLEDLGEVGRTVRLYTHLAVREDAVALYGFATPEQLELFEALLGVSGVGAKMALGILSTATPETLRQAIAGEDVAMLTRVPGVGPKMAGRLILELKGRVDLARLGLPGAAPLSQEQAELIEVLTTLGYTAAEARAAVSGLPADARDLPLEERLRLALRYFGGA